jgi:hypothetical protein
MFLLKGIANHGSSFKGERKLQLHQIEGRSAE